MGSYRTVFLLTLAAACGIGSGVLGLFYDGLATVALFMAFPLVVAVLFLSIVHDLVNERVSETEPGDLVTPLSQAASAESGPGSGATQSGLIADQVGIYHRTSLGSRGHWLGG